MHKNLKPLILLFFFLVVTSAPLLAQDADLSNNRTSLFKLSLIMGAAVITLASAAGIFGQSKAISSACEGISRNPNAGPHIRFLLIFGLVLIETLVIYALLISIIILIF